MPRLPKAKSTQQPVVPTTALLASGHRYLGKAPRLYSPSKEWQKQAYGHYSNCGEARFAARYFGHAMSRAVLYTAGKDKVPTEGTEAAAALEDLFGGDEGQAGMLDSIGTHLTVAGECYVVGREVDGADIWEVVSVVEIEDGAAGWRILSSEDATWIPLDDDAVIIRIWVPKPDRRWEADSPFRSMLPVLDEIEWLSRYIHSQATSRLAGNGLLVLPDGVTFPPPPPKDGKEQEYANQAEGFMLMLGEMMMEALKGDGSAAEQVPGIITAPGEFIDKIQHLTFWTELDENAREMRKDAIHRFATGMDLPIEMVLGMGSNEGTGGGNSNGVSHWGAWMIEEQAIKLHIEPMLDVVVAALTSSYLRPLVGGEEVIRYDTSALRLRPDRSKESIELFNLGLLKPEVVIRENGFDPDDMMDDEARKQWLLMKIASGSATPEQVDAALRELGVNLNAAAPAAPGAPETRETPQPPSLEEHPVRPRTPEPSSMLSTYEALVFRALERAGNRLRSLTQVKTPGHSYEAHTVIAANGSAAKCLEDAWATAPMVLEGNEQASTIIASLDSYCRVLLANQEPHTREALAAWCEKTGI